MKIQRNLLTTLAGMAALVLTTGLAYGDIILAWPSLSEAAMTAGQGTPVMTWAPDATIPAGLGTDGVTWGNSLVPGATFQQMYYNVGSAMGSQNASGYAAVNFFILPGAGNSAGALQIVLQSSANGYMQPGSGATVTSLANGWKEVTYSLSNTAFTATPGALNAIYSIGIGFWQPTAAYQMELGGITFTGQVPEPSSLALLGFGVVAFGLTAIQRRKLVK
ncbi:MAG: PEP-CTERM sorting domain-containing protein [Verrucomicrobiota bacterium]|jgi:hypothetical protein